MPIYLASVLLALLTATIPVIAAPAVVITPASVPDRVHSQNPDLAAARLRISEALGRLNQSGRLANPEIESSFEHNPRFREEKIEIGVSQRFPLTQRLALEKQVSLTELKAAEAEVRDVERRLVAEAREAVVGVLTIRLRRDLLHTQADLSGQLASFLQEAARKGEGSPLDAGLARLEAASLSTELSQLDAAEATARGKIKPLLGMLPGAPLEIGGQLAEPVIPKGKVDPARRPDFQATALDAQAAGQSVSLEKSRCYEDMEAGLFAGAERTEDAPEGYENEAIIGIRFKIPLPLWNQNQGAIQEAEARSQRKELETRALARTIRLEAETASAEMAQWAKLIRELRDDLLPLADEQSQLAETAFRNGQGEIQTVFRSREKRLQLAAARIDALREFHLARIRYDSALAQP